MAATRRTPGDDRDMDTLFAISNFLPRSKQSSRQ